MGKHLHHIFMVDDHRMFSESIRLMMEKMMDADKFLFRTIYDSGEDLMRSYKSVKRSIFLVDIEMPGKNGLEVIDFLRKKDDESKIIVISQNIAASMILRAIELGANGYLAKNSKPDVIARAIEAITEDRTLPYFCQKVEQIVMQQVVTANKDQKVELLAANFHAETWDVYRLISLNYTTGQIASILGFSTGLVKKIRRRVKENTNTSKAEQQVQILRDSGLLSEELSQQLKRQIQNFEDKQ